MSNVTFIEDKIRKEMNAWSKQEYQNKVHYLARKCNCNTRYISCIPIYPGDKEGYDCGFVFFGPEDVLLGEIRWNKDGRCTDFIPYDDNIAAVHDYLAQRRAERARAKSVNKNQQQAEEREISLGKELVGFVKTHVKELAAAACLMAALASAYVTMSSSLNPDYINDSYNAGYQAVSYETHGTIYNDGNYWYDYGDIAERYDDKYDFDSWVYGAYRNVGWNQQSKLACMDDVFAALEARGITEYDSFLEYCDAKGVCVEKDGKLVIDTEQFRVLTEGYMVALNKGEVPKKEDSDYKGTNYRI